MTSDDAAEGSAGDWSQLVARSAMLARRYEASGGRSAPGWSSDQLRTFGQGTHIDADDHADWLDLIGDVDATRLIGTVVLKQTDAGNRFLLQLRPDGSLEESLLDDPSDVWSGSWAIGEDRNVEGLIIRIGPYLSCLFASTLCSSLRGPEFDSEKMSPNGYVLLTPLADRSVLSELPPYTQEGWFQTLRSAFGAGE